MNGAANVVIFYVSVAVLAAGVMRALRASVERNMRDRVGILMAAGGALGLIVAIIVFITGPKTTLPF